MTTRHPFLLLLLAACALSAAALVVASQDSQRPGVRSPEDAAQQREHDERRAAERFQARAAWRDRLLRHYDATNLQVERTEFLAPGVDKDGIPALTEPKREFASRATYPADPGARVVVVTLNEQTVAYPIGILNYHEIVNDVVAGRPIAVTYCPLCDSVSVFERRLGVEQEDGTTSMKTLEFGVSGLLLNSNVVMYERDTMALWSQVAMEPLSGPHVGQRLEHLPFRMMSAADFRKAHPDALILSDDTGHERDYTRNPYRDYFTSERLFGDFEFGDELPAKTLGVGIRAGDVALFFTEKAVAGERLIETQRGPFRLAVNDSGFVIGDLPDGVTAVQTFYHSWSAFHPQTEVIAEPADPD
jgi:hypothetical protein